MKAAVATIVVVGPALFACFWVVFAATSTEFRELSFFKQFESVSLAWTPIGALMAAALLLLAVLMQKRELELQRQEFAETRQVLGLLEASSRSQLNTLARSSATSMIFDACDRAGKVRDRLLSEETEIATKMAELARHRSRLVSSHLRQTGQYKVTRSGINIITMPPAPPKTLTDDERQNVERIDSNIQSLRDQAGELRLRATNDIDRLMTFAEKVVSESIVSDEVAMYLKDFLSEVRRDLLG